MAARIRYYPGNPYGIPAPPRPATPAELAKGITAANKAAATVAAFLKKHRRAGSPAMPPAPNTGASNDLASLWVQAGGPPNVANTMAAIAMAESAGRNVVQQGQPYATTGWGLWQITPGNKLPSIGVDNALLDPLTNAKAAVAVYRSQGFGAWTTYTNGAYRSFLGSAGSVVPGASGRTRPGGQTAGTPPPSGVDTLFADYQTSLSGGEDVGLLGGVAGGIGGFLLGGPWGAAAGAAAGDTVTGGNPLSDISSSINSTTDFLKFISWIFHPVNILRAVEFLVGIAIMGFGLQAAFQARGEAAEGYQTSEEAISRSGVGRVARELGRAAVTKSKPVKPKPAPHKTRRTALRVRYEREQQVSDRNEGKRRGGKKAI